jgi:hypothetical protein
LADLQAQQSGLVLVYRAQNKKACAHGAVTKF